MTTLLAPFPHLARGPRGQSRCSADHQKHRPNHDGGAASQPGDLATAGSAANQHPTRNADRMQDCGRCHKPKTKQEARSGLRHFSAVSMTTENCEHTDKRHRDCDGNADRERDHGAEHQHRQCDPGFKYGIVTPTIPAMPAAAITAMKVPGTSHNARPPSWAANTPTASMAMT